MAEKDNLEGKYLVHIYNECDYEDEGTGLRIDLLKDGKLECILNPGAIWSPTELKYKTVFSNGVYITPTERAIEILKKREVKEVVTLLRTKDFHTIPHGIICLDEEGADEREGICNNWFELKTVYNDTYEYGALEDRDIKVRLFDTEKNEYRE